jgi:hypothetical protein
MNADRPFLLPAADEPQKDTRHPGVCELLLVDEDCIGPRDRNRGHALTIADAFSALS